MTPLPLITQPMVEYLNSLRTQEREANPTYVYENRRDFLDALRATYPWFPPDEALHVRTRLDALATALAADQIEVNAIFLTGDAGDGKTALCALLARQLGHADELAEVTQAGGWIIVKDASEIEEARLKELIEQHVLGGGGVTRLLVAINEGRLRRIMRQEPRFAALWENLVQPSLEAWIDQTAAERLDERMRAERVLVVNFRHRFHVRTAVPALLMAWTPEKLWEQASCGSCTARETCPILANAASLRVPETQHRITDVLTSAHFSGQRLPFRRLQAVLALTITAGLRCLDVQTGALSATSTLTPLTRLGYRFYEALFRTERSKPVQVQAEPVVRTFAPADGGLAADLSFDREVSALTASNTHGAGQPLLRGQALPPLEREAVAYVQRVAMTGEASNFGVELARLTQCLRRWRDLTIVTPEAERPTWRRALALLEDYANGKDGVPLKRAVVGALNRLHRAEATTEDSLVRRQLDPAGFRDPARLALELDLGVRFEARLRRGPELPPVIKEWLEGCASEVILEARPEQSSESWAQLPLNARLVETLLGVREGFTFLGALGPYRRDLARFFSQLLARASTSGHAPRVILRADNKSYHVSTTTSSGAVRLRFEGDG
ncbi:hypothetical protein [Sorangium sp. So ce1335]|uniref:hypothetical protein n=1 Tax=Sorangium sp. So ce1335 TaxID=3133335 RepID=UPI003F6020CA